MKYSNQIISFYMSQMYDCGCDKDFIWFEDIFHPLNILITY